MREQEIKEAILLMKITINNLSEVANALADQADGLRATLKDLNQRLEALSRVMATMSSRPPCGPVH